MKLTAFNHTRFNVRCIALELEASERIGDVIGWEQKLSIRLFFGKLCSVSLHINKYTESFIFKKHIKYNNNLF